MNDGPPSLGGGSYNSVAGLTEEVAGVKSEIPDLKFSGFFG